MSDGTAAGLRPQRQWPLWLGLAAAAVWLASVTLTAMHAAGPVRPAMVAAAMPPVIVALIVVSLLRAIRPDPDIAAIEARLLHAGDEAAGLATLLADVDLKLASCADRTARLAAASATTGEGLAATALRLTTAAGEVDTAGISADVAATRLAATLPDLTRVEQMIASMGDRLGRDTVKQLEIIDALLTSVQVRGDEVSTQADVAITSINKQLADIDEQSRQTTSRIAKRAYALDAAVDGASTRATSLLDGVATTIAERMAAMDDHLAAMRVTLDAVGEDGTAVIAARLDQLHVAAADLSRRFAEAESQNALFTAAVDDQLATLPARLGAVRADGVEALESIARHAGAAHDAIGALTIPLGASTASLTELDQRVAALHTAVQGVEQMLADALPAQLAMLDQGAGQVDERLGSARGSIAAAHQATLVLSQAVSGIRGEVALLGDADLRLVDDRLAATAAVMHDVGRQITAYAALSSQSKAAVEAELADLSRQVREAEEDGGTRLSALGDQVGLVHGAIDDLAVPLAAARRVVDDIEVQTRHAADAAATFHDQLGTQVATATTEFDRMQDRAGALLAEAAALETTTRSGGEAIDLAGGRFAVQRDAFAAAAATLSAEFDRAREVLDALDHRAIEVAGSSATALGDTFDRARQLAEANAEALRTMLAAIVTDTGQALAETGSAVAASAFGDPIRHELAAITIAANDTVGVADVAGSRIAGQAAALKSTVAEVAAKVDELETRLDVRARDTLSARSTRLIEMLQSASVDIARLLSADVGEQAWARYAKGDRSLFARRTVQLVNRGIADKIARHFAHDPAFADEASHYLDLFEKLSRRIERDPDGDTLLATIVSSDIGKLYVIIARATGRWRPAA